MSHGIPPQPSATGRDANSTLHEREFVVPACIHLVSPCPILIDADAGLGGAIAMRIRNNENNQTAGRVKRGRAVVVGLGLDDSDGHVRYTRDDCFELFGGSESAHGEMQRRIKVIREEIAKLGITLDRMTYEQYEMLRDIVERVNCE